MENESNASAAPPTNEGAPTSNATPPIDEPPAKEPRFLTVDQLNGALTARERRQEARFMKLMQETLAKSRGEAPPPVDPDQQRALEALKALEAERSAELQAAKEREAALLEREARSVLDDELRAVGITSRAAAALLREDGRVSRNADGEIVFVGDDGSETSLAVGLREWAKSDEAKGFMLPIGGGGGSGWRPRGDHRSSMSTTPEKPSRAEAAAQLQRWVLGRRS